MKKIVLILLIVCIKSVHFPLFGQEKTVLISPDSFDELQRISLATLDGWIFHKGTDKNRRQAEADIDVKGWIPMKPTQLTREFEDKDGRLEGWFRMKCILSSKFDSIPLSLNRDLWAATEVYIDGKLVHAFGKTGTTQKDFEFYNPNHQIPIPLDLQPNREYILAIHFVNYEGAFTPGKVTYNEDNLANLLNLTGPRFTEVKQQYRRSSYIHSTLWITVSFIFTMLFWMMSIQNPNERIFKVIMYWSLFVFLLALSKILTNFFELNFTQEKIRFFAYASIGPLTLVYVIMVTELIIKRKNSVFSKIWIVALSVASLISHYFNFSAVFGTFNSALIIYFLYLIIDNRKQITRVQWSVLLAMIFYIFASTTYLILRKTSGIDYFIYGNLIYSILTIAPLIAFLIYVALRFKEIFQERENAQLEKNKQLKAINAASAKFVPSPFLNFLGKQNILEATLGDHVEKKVTVMFTDIRDYTSLSEKMTPEENFRFVNAFNRRMGPIIQKHNGFVNQYLGDCIMAIFPDNTEDPLHASIEMQKEIGRYNQSRMLKNQKPIRIGIGLHAGPLIMGIIGDEQRMDAATISDTVNAASRIEGLTKYFGVNILLSGSCVNKLPEKERFNLRFLGIVQVKGKENTVKIYECFDGDDTETMALKKETSIDFERGVKLYFSQDFNGAENVFQHILTKNSKDKPAALFFQRATHLKVNGADATWTGVERMLKK